MTQDVKNLRVLEHIVDYCDDILSSVERFGRDSSLFSSDRDYRNSCMLSLMQIGELAKKLTDEFRGEFDEMPWGQISGLRNIIAHDYINIDHTAVWLTINKDIPPLKRYCETISNLLRQRISEE